MNLLKRYRRWRMRRELKSIDREIDAVRRRADRFALTSEWTNEILLKGKKDRADSLKKELGEENSVDDSNKTYYNKL